MSQKPITIRYDDAKHQYWIDDVLVPSVSQVLDATLPKPALTWWGFRVGMACVVQLSKTDQLSWPALLNHEWQEVIDNEPAPERTHYMPNDKKRKKPRTLLEQLAIMRRLHPNAIKDDAATRGTSAHEALVQLGMGEVPDVYGPDSIFPEEDRPFVQGLIRWWMDHEPEFIVQEQIVGSRKHQYAGRFDLIIRERSGDVVLMDLKSGKNIYPDSHFRQLKGYEIAWLEGGGQPIDALKILNVRKDGSYVYSPPAKVRDEHFLDCLTQLRSMRSFEALQKGEPELELAAAA